MLANRYSASDTPVSTRIASAVFESMVVLCHISKAKETGGVLVGKYDKAGIVVEVLEALSPPDDSQRTASTFFRGISGLSEKLTHRWKKSGTHYIGEWHYHPTGDGQPSNQDITQMIEFAKAEDMQSPFPIMVIVFPSDRNQYEIRVFLFTREGQSLELTNLDETQGGDL